MYILDGNAKLAGSKHFGEKGGGGKKRTYILHWIGRGYGVLPTPLDPLLRQC